MPAPLFVHDFDPRLTPARDDLAASWLRGKVDAARYVDPYQATITAPIAALYRTANGGAMDTQLLHGEAVDVFDDRDGWAWVQSASDSYVGYVETAQLGKAMPAPTHRVSNVATHVYPGASYKDTPQATLSYGSLVTVTGGENGLSQLAGGGYVPSVHLAGLDFPSDEMVAEAFRFLGVPYLWGGRGAAGLDCSALIQLVLQAAGRQCPRDADLQEKFIGKPIDRNVVQGGDLVFFRGHVGLMIDDTTMIHANDRTMAVSIDDLDEYVKWRGKNGKTPVKMFKRV